MTKVLITRKDILSIVDGAKKHMSSMNMPVYISEELMEYNDLRAVSYVESVLNHLNRKNLLTTVPQIEYSDPTAKYDQDSPEEK